MNRQFKVIELFSGIGAQAEALKKIGADFEVLNTCEWNIHAMMAYGYIHGMIEQYDEPTGLSKDELINALLEKGVSADGKSPLSKSGAARMDVPALDLIYRAISDTRNLVDVSAIKGAELPNEIDILTYSFPCQDLSNAGSLHGYTKGIDKTANSRSGLLWQVERILLERAEAGMFLPKYLIMENVPSLNAERHRKNFIEWQDQLKALGYYNKQYVLDAKNFGLPQHRERLIMLSILTYNDSDIERDLETYFWTHNLKDLNYVDSLGLKKHELKDLLRVDYSNKVYKDEAILCQPNDTPSRRKIWDENPQLTDLEGNIIATEIPTLTTKQDRHPNSGNLRVNFDNGKGPFRYLTPRECFLLMGFEEKDYETVIRNNVSIGTNAKLFTRDNLIKMAGNSIVVNVLEAVFKQIIDIDAMLY